MVASTEISFASKGLEDLSIPHEISVNPSTGAAQITVGIPSTASRSDFHPTLSLAYGSSQPNSAFGIGWTLSGVPSIGLSLKDGLPKYDGSDTYAFGGTELIPWLEETTAEPRVLDGEDYWRHLYRSKFEQQFVRFERWVHKETRRTHWRSRDRNNTLSIFGLDEHGTSRISDPENEHRTYQWLLEAQYDQHGNAIHYESLPENADNVDVSTTFERNRVLHSRGFAQRYLKTIRYGNSRPLVPDDPIPSDNQWLFEIVLDYGEHDGGVYPAYDPARSWVSRPDPFSSYRAGFEVRTYRLCRSILMFHHFVELGTGPTLVGALELRHRDDPVATTLEQVSYDGYRRESGTNVYSKKALPPLVFHYSEPELGRAFIPAPQQTHENAPYGIGGLNYRWIDLYGEGLPGILCETNQAWYFKSNLGGGVLGVQHKVLDRPSINLGEYAVSDFDGDGNLNLVVLQGRQAGYYEYDRDGGRWQSFQAFAAAPQVEPLGARTQLLDLNGDGRADIVSVKEDRITWYPSKGKEGFDAPIEFAKPRTNGVSHAPTIGPNLGLDYFFADMTGDGLPDQVRVTNGRVEYWPQLGHGKFGEGVVMAHSPSFDLDTEFDASRIRFVDLDGSGTSDILYIGRGEINYWINANGNRFIEGGTIRGLPYIDNISSATVLDFLGDGTLCLVWSTTLPGRAEEPLQYLQLTSGVKPRLLHAVENSMGKEITLTYSNSATHYLRDTKSGNAWVSKLPQHVTVVDRLEVTDHIGNTRSQSRYEYHDGFYDSEEREFRGFSLVDQYDTNVYQNTSTVPEHEYADPVCARTWFHNGMDGWESRREQNYYRGDSQAASLPESFIEDRHTLKPDEWGEAFRALAGQVVRTELYGIGADGQRAADPYQITQTNYRIRRVQPHRESQDPCFAGFPNESLTYVYEQDPADPRVAHTFTLQVDDFGNVTRSCSVAYPRRSTQRIGIDAQERLHVSVSQADIINVDEPYHYELGLPRASLSFEVAELSPLSGGVTDALLRLDDLIGELHTALQPDQILRFDQPFTGGTQARLMQWNRWYYWNNARSDVLPWSEVGTRPLEYYMVHHTEVACCTDMLFTDVFGTRLAPEAAREEGLYRSHDGYWWQASPTLHYLPAARFNLLEQTVQRLRIESRPVDAVTSYAYNDPYWLHLTSVTDALGNRVEASRIDYHISAPEQITDPNDNVSEVRYDPLGVVVAATQ